MSKKVYQTNINAKTDIETLKAVLKVYLTAYELNYKVKVRAKLVDTLVVYMLHGINRESDQMLADMGGTPIANIRVHKHELRNLGLIKKNIHNHGKSELRQELVDLVNLFNDVQKQGPNDFLYIVTLKNINNG